MNSTLIFMFLILATFAACRFFSKFAESFIFLNSAIFAILGLALGSNMGFGILNQTILESTNLFIYFIIGLLSFTSGLKIDFKEFMKGHWFPSGLLSFVQLFFIFALMLLVFLLSLLITMTETPSWSGLLEFTTKNEFKEMLLLVLLISILSLFTSGLSHFFNHDHLKKHTPVFNATIKISSLMQGIAIIAASSTIFFIKLEHLADSEKFYSLVLRGFTVLLAPMLAILFAMFIGSMKNGPKIVLATLGGVLFASGSGLAIGHSIFILPFLMGLFLNIFFKESSNLAFRLKSFEYPAGIFIIMITGAHLAPIRPSIIFIAAIYIGLRLFFYLYLANAFLGPFMGRQHFGLPMSGRGFIAQGPFIVGMALLLNSNLPTMGNDLLVLALVSVICNEYFGSRFAKDLMIDCDELTPENK
ncbi:MAG: hypothetical protein HQK50_15235 [Oligoflexia bacterium]|nr:hypothetical protein [Oligoflexia bacterium]